MSQSTPANLLSLPSNPAQRTEQVVKDNDYITVTKYSDGTTRKDLKIQQKSILDEA